MGYFQTKDGAVLSRDILPIRDSKTYVITVSTPDYWIEVLESGEEKGSVPNYVLENVSDIKEVCKSLAKKTINELSPYLTEAGNKI